MDHLHIRPNCPTIVANLPWYIHDPIHVTDLSIRLAVPHTQLAHATWQCALLCTIHLRFVLLQIDRLVVENDLVSI